MFGHFNSACKLYYRQLQDLVENLQGHANACGCVLHTGGHNSDMFFWVWCILSLDMAMTHNIAIKVLASFIFLPVLLDMAWAFEADKTISEDCSDEPFRIRYKCFAAQMIQVKCIVTSIVNWTVPEIFDLQKPYSFRFRFKGHSIPCPHPVSWFQERILSLSEPNVWPLRSLFKSDNKNSLLRLAQLATATHRTLDSMILCNAAP